jgi:hypothetical protein
LVVCPGIGLVVVEPVPDVPTLEPFPGIAVDPVLGWLGVLPDVPALDPLPPVIGPLLFRLGVDSNGVVAPGL